MPALAPTCPSRVYLAPGMFGFAQLGSLDYFEHMVAALRDRFRSQRRDVEVFVCEMHPTASLRHRAKKLAEMVANTSGTDAGPIHLLGHSTGGLDARLVVSPSVTLDQDPAIRATFIDRVRSVTTVNTPHHGTPLATFFATVSGQRAMAAVTAITVAVLKLGAPPLLISSAVVAALGRIQGSFLEVELVDRMIEAVIRLLDEAASRELRTFLKLLRDDQAGILQITPEAMDLFQLMVPDHPAVRYQSVATYATGAGAADLLGAFRSPWRAVSAPLFIALSKLAAPSSKVYGCTAPGGSNERMVAHRLGEAPPPTANDGIVPFYSQLYGDVLWMGKADHLDIVGHFPGTSGHHDWLASGARFSGVRFDVVMDRIVRGMIAAEAAHEKAASPEAKAPAEANYVAPA